MAAPAPVVAKPPEEMVTCAKCTESLPKRHAVILGKLILHKACFTCTVCNEHMSGKKFYPVKDKEVYCENDFLTYVAPKCAACGSGIPSHAVHASNRTWHAECFVCSVCKTDLIEVGHYFEDGKAFCASCVPKKANENAQICAACTKPIDGMSVMALNRHYHGDCFVCSHCGEAVAECRFVIRGGRPLHAECRDALDGL